MKNRMYSYGYGCVNGQLAVIPEEAAVVKRVFSDYVSGKIMKQIADELTATEVEFYCGKTVWNKNMIFRILENRKYLGEDCYPSIIDSETFEKANGIKRSKGSTQTEDSKEIAWLKEKVFCGQCGRRMTRIAKWKTREKWICHNGCKCKKYTDDGAIYSAIASIVTMITDDGTLLQSKEEFVPYQKTQEIMRYGNEIGRLMNAGNVEFNAVKNVILQSAALKFTACREDKSVYTKVVEEYLLSILADGVIDVANIDKIVEKIEIAETGEIALRFINGVKVSNRKGGESDGNGSAQDRNEDRSEPAFGKEQ